MHALNHAARGVGALLALTVAAPALAQKSMLRSNEYLKANEYLVADNKQFFAIMQGDGNFCVYRGSGPADNKGFAYCTKSAQGAGAYFAAMQGDGNFCVYRGTGPGDNKGFVMCTNSARGAGQYFAIMQGDGNFVVYRGTGPGDNKGLVWDSLGASSGSSSGAAAFFSGVGDWFKGAGNTIADAFKGKVKASINTSTVQVGGSAAELSVTGKTPISQRTSRGTGQVAVTQTSSSDGEYVDAVNRKMTYSVKGVAAGPVTLVFGNSDSSTEVGMTVLAAPPPPQFTRVTAGRSYLTTNQFMRDGDYLVADNKAYFAIMQGDGNFCIYRGSGPGDNKGNVYCTPGRSSGAGAYFAAVQADGNFCVYRGTGPGDNKGIVTCSNSARFPGSYFLAMQGDGNLVIYSGTGPADNKGFVWQR